MSPIIYAGAAGIAAAGIMLFLSHVAPFAGAGRVVQDTDTMRLFGRQYSRREAHVAGILVHIAASFCFGVLYAWSVSLGIVSGYGFWPLSAYALLLTIVVGGVLMPLEGHGLFGRKEDPWFAFDLLLANIGWVILFALIIRLLPV